MSTPVNPSFQTWPGTENDRERLRLTFDRAAALYQRARPDYPEELFDALVGTARLVPGDRVLEVGTATGKATLPLVRRGYRITGLEPGPSLAATARMNMEGLSVDIIENRFEDWEADPDFDLVFAATSWHWIDPKVKYAKAWRLLRPGGHLAFWSASHVFPPGGDPLFRDLQPVYDEISEPMAPDAPRPQPGELADQRDEIEATGLFHVVLVRHFDWERVYDAEGYIELLETFSGHISMEQWQRDRLYGEIRHRVGQRPDGLLRRHWGAVLHVARRINAPRDGSAPSKEGPDRVRPRR